MRRPAFPPADSVASWTDGEFTFAGDYANLTNPNLYTVSPSNISQFQSKFDILIRAQSTSRTFRINAFNITEGSEVVKIDVTLNVVK